MTAWAKRQLFDRVYDRWKERDEDYSRANANRGTVSTFFRSDEIIETDEKGRLVGQEIFNGSGSWFSRMMANGFQGSLVSKNISWIRYQMQQFELKGVDQIDAWLQRANRYMVDVYQRSNFYDIQPQFTHDGVTTGSPVIFGEENIKEQRIMWQPQHFKNVRAYYDKWNLPEGVIVQDRTWTAKQLMDTFVGPDDDAGTKRKRILSNEANASINAGELDDTFIVYRAVFKRTDPIWDGQGENAFQRPQGDHGWLTAWFEDLADADRKLKDRPLNENMGDFSQPFSIWDYDKKPWEATSRTPAFYALWDNLSLQQLDKNYMQDLQTVNRPPTIALASMNGKLQLGPEGEMFVSNENYDRPPKPLDRIGGLQFNLDWMEMKETALRRWFFIDIFQMFSQLATDKNQPVSAQQIWRMAGEKATQLSPAVETHSAHLETSDARMVDIEVRAGRGPFAPDEIENITDIVVSQLGEGARSIDIQPVFIGPLAQAQKVSQALEPIQTGLEAARPVIEVFPEARHAYRPYKIIELQNEAIDFPQDAVVPEEEFNEIVQAERQAIAQQQQQENAIEMAKASKDVSGPVDENSLLARATG